LSRTLLLENGVVYGHPAADAILLREGRILAIGKSHDLRGRFNVSARSRVFPLDGRMVIPGFIDAHTHFLQTGWVASGRVISLVGLSREEAVEAISAAGTRQPDGEWILARGWDESSWASPVYLSQQELDRAAPRHPVAAVRVDGHIMVLNSLGTGRWPPEIERPLHDGEEPGVVREEAVFAFGRAMEAGLGPRMQDRAFQAAAEFAHSLGITSVHAMASPWDVDVYRRVCERRLIRMNVCPERPAAAALTAKGIRTGSGDEWLRYGGIKLFADGSIGAANAAVGEPFIGRTRGRLNHSDEDVQEFIADCDRRGWQTVIHAIGDRAIEQVLAAHEAVGSTPDLRHRIEHYELPQEPHLARTEALGIWLCVQPNFIGQWSGPDSLYVERLGDSRDRKSNPLRAILDAGIHVGFGSDGMPMGPLYGIRSALQAPYPGQRIGFDEAIAAYTQSAAALSHEEHIKGSLDEGKRADLVVLSSSDAVASMLAGEVKVDATFLDGELVFEREHA